MNQGPPRTLLLAGSIAGILLFLVLLVLLIKSNLTTYPDLTVGDAIWEDETSSDSSAGTRSFSAATEYSVYTHNDTGLSDLPSSIAAPSGGGERLEKLVDLSVGTRVNRAVSFSVFDKTLKNIQARSADKPELAEDLGYVRDQLARLAVQVEKGNVSEQQLKKFMLTGIRAGRDRRISRQEFSLLLAAARTELGLKLDGAETERVLASLQQPHNREDVKQALAQETATVLKEVLGNPVTRRLAVFGAEQVFLLYEDKINAKIPPGVGKREVKTMFYTMLDKVVKKRIPDSELTALAGMMVSAAADRQITPAETQKMAAILKKYLPTPALKNIMESIDARR